jgi:transposase
MDRMLKGNLFIKYIKEFEAVVDEVLPSKKKSFQHNLKYSVKDYLLGITEVLKTGVSWNSYKGLIKGNTLNKKHILWSSCNIYSIFYERVLTKYINSVPKTKEFKYISVDSTFILDKKGSEASGFNSYYGKKKKGKGIKVTNIVTATGIPIASSFDPGNCNDAPLFDKVIDNMAVNTNSLKYVNNNRYKQYLSADKGYDSKKIRKKIKKRGFIPVIPRNKRNCKKNTVPSLTVKEINILKKRHIVENYFSWIKKMRRVEYLYEKNIKNYEGFYFLAMSLLIIRKSQIKNKYPS